MLDAWARSSRRVWPFLEQTNIYAASVSQFLPLRKAARRIRIYVSVSFVYASVSNLAWRPEKRNKALKTLHVAAEKESKLAGKQWINKRPSHNLVSAVYPSLSRPPVELFLLLKFWPFAGFWLKRKCGLDQKKNRRNVRQMVAARANKQTKDTAAKIQLTQIQHTHTHTYRWRSKSARKEHSKKAREITITTNPNQQQVQKVQSQMTSTVDAGSAVDAGRDA